MENITFLSPLVFLTPMNYLYIMVNLQYLLLIMMILMLKHMCVTLYFSEHFLTCSFIYNL